MCSGVLKMENYMFRVNMNCLNLFKIIIKKSEVYILRSFFLNFHNNTDNKKYKDKTMFLMIKETE